MLRPRVRGALLTLAGLLLGLLLGLAGGSGGVEAARWVCEEALGPLGLAFLALIQMGILPLVATAVVLAIVRIGDLGRVGRMGGAFFAVVVPVLLFAAAVGAGAGAVLLPLREVSPEAAARLIQSVDSGIEGSPPSLVQFLVDLVPRNPLAAAAQGALLPVVVFCAFLGVALLRMEESRRAPLVGVLEAVEAAMGRIFGWVLAVAPIGVFALAASAAAQVGWDLLAELGWYLLVVAVALAVLLAALYGGVRLLGGVRISAFARAALPAQAVAFSTTSSMASLPALFDGAEKSLGLPRSVSRLVLPIGVSIFRAGSAAFMVVAALFAARLHGGGGEFEARALLLAIPVAAFASLSVPSVPFGSFVAMAPVFHAVGAPLEAYGLLVAVDRIPDMLRTATNVTATLSVPLVARLREA
jgi:Na+/H+-dicarboxylate symporter